MIHIFKNAFSNLQFRSLFIKLMISFLGLIVFIAVLTSFAFKSWYDKSILEKDLDSAGLQRIDETRSFMDSLLKEIHNMTISIANNPSAAEAFKLKDSTRLYASLLETGREFRQRYMSSYAVNSIHFYIKGSVLVQMPIYGATNVSNFDLSTVLSSVDTMGREDKWVVQTQPRSENSSSAMLILIRPLPLIGTKVEGAMVVTFDPQTFLQSPFYQQPEENIWMLLPDGKHALETKSGSLMEEKDFTNLQSRLQKGETSFQSRILGSNQEIRVNPSQLPGWKYIYTVPVQHQQRVAGILILVLLGAGVLVTGYYVWRTSRLIHRHIMTLTAMLEKKRQTATQKLNTYDEFDYMINELHHLLEDDKALRERLQSVELLNKQNFLHHLLRESSLYRDERLSQFHELKLAVSDHGFFAAIIRIDHYPGFTAKYNKADQNLLRYFIAKLAEEELSPYFHVNQVTSDRDVILICNVLGKSTISVVRSMALNHMNSICQYIHGYLEVSVSVGIGDYHLDIGNISESYTQARQALEFRMYKGSKALIPIWHITANQQMIMLLYEERQALEQEMVQAIQHNDTGKLSGSLEKLIRTLTDLDGCPLPLIHHTLWEMAMYIHHHTNHTGSSRFKLQDWHEALVAMEELPEMAQHLGRMAEDLMTLQNGQAAPAASAKVIDHILEYIQMNHSKDISLNGIADQLQMDPSYL
ncbi:MAG: transcriptional regulator, AraC family, partial [Paenibacillus sp.]|nr:transcriptional regulator, AraC family [Paenibacillus sp.]